MDQLIELALKMPPSVSAGLSLLVLAVIWFLGRKISAEMQGVSKKLEDASDKLGAIEKQTTMTNGRVTTLEALRIAHENSDNERHQDIDEKHRENKGNFGVLFEKHDELDRKLDRLIEAKGGA